MQLVLLCREQDFSFFAQDLVFDSLVNLKDLEENDVVLADGKVHKGKLCAIDGHITLVASLKISEIVTSFADIVRLTVKHFTQYP